MHLHSYKLTDSTEMLRYRWLSELNFRNNMPFWTHSHLNMCLSSILFYGNCLQRIGAFVHEHNWIKFQLFNCFHEIFCLFPSLSLSLSLLKKNKRNLIHVKMQCDDDRFSAFSKMFWNNLLTFSTWHSFFFFFFYFFD